MYRTTLLPPKVESAPSFVHGDDVVRSIRMWGKAMIDMGSVFYEHDAVAFDGVLYTTFDPHERRRDQYLAVNRFLTKFHTQVAEYKSVAIRDLVPDLVLRRVFEFLN